MHRRDWPAAVYRRRRTIFSRAPAEPPPPTTCLVLRRWLTPAFSIPVISATATNTSSGWISISRTIGYTAAFFEQLLTLAGRHPFLSSPPLTPIRNALFRLTIRIPSVPQR